MNKVHSSADIRWQQIGIFGLAATVLITLFSACSWLYPLNPWDDANCFFMLGKSLTQGVMPYRDIFDHKGPGVYLWQALGALICDHNFIGIYLTEILGLWLYLVYAYRTMRLFTQNPIALPFTLLLGTALTTSDFFYYGNTVEEFGLPWIMLSLYYLLAYAKYRQVPSATASIVMGLGVGMIFWMKFTVLSPFVGAFLAILILCIRDRRMADFGRVLGFALIGFGIVSIAICTFFAAIGGFWDMIDGYFGYNLFRYHAAGAEGGGGEEMGIYPLRLVAWLALVMIPLLHRKVQGDVRLLVTMSFATTLILFAITTVYIYYFIICYAFFPLLIYYVRKWELNRKNGLICGLIALLLMACNFQLMQRIRGTFPQAILSIAEELDQEDPSVGIMEYRSRETGIYTYTHHMPPMRYFFLLSVVHEELKKDQDKCLNSRRCKYVLVKDQVLAPEVYEAIPAAGYELIETRTELFRTLKLLNPKIFLWNLGWPQPLMRVLVGEVEPETAVFRLYRKIEN